MRDRDYIRGMRRRIARAENEADSAIQRAFDRALSVLYRERREYILWCNRKRRAENGLKVRVR